MAISKQLLGVGCEELVHTYLLFNGFETYRPTSPLSCWDVGVIVNGRDFKIQVKCGKVVSDQKVYVDARKGSAKQRHYSATDFDLLAVVIPQFQTPRIAFVPRRRFNVAFTLWLSRDVSMNGRRIEYREPLFFDDFLDFPAMTASSEVATS